MLGEDVSAIIYDHKIQNECAGVSYPQVGGLKDRNIQNEINRLLKEQILAMIPAEGCDVYQTINGAYKITLNQKGILSVKFNVYTFRWHAANGLDVQKAITLNLETGKVYRLNNLFRPDSGYRAVLTKLIKKQIAERNLPLIKEFKSVADNQKFYLTNNSLVIYFQEIQYTPHYVGIPEFPIPFWQIRNLINEQGPIARFVKKPPGTKVVGTGILPFFDRETYLHIK